MTKKTALSLFGGAMIALGGTTATAQEQESLDEWMNRVTGQESTPTPAERPAETTPLDSKSIDEPTSGTIDRSTSDAVTERIDRSRKNYFRLRAGVSITPDLELQSIGPTASDLVGLSNGKIELDPGLDFQLVYGRRIADGLYLEFATQSAWNVVSGISGTVFRVDGGGNVVDQSSIQGGSGYLVQWPLTVGLGYVIDVTDDIQINLNGGVGVQFNFSYLEPPTVSSFSSSAYSWYAQTSVAFRGQLGASISFAVSDSVSLGLFAGWSAVSGANLGKANLISRSIRSDDLEAEVFMNYAIGGALVIEF